MTVPVVAAWKATGGLGYELHSRSGTTQQLDTGWSLSIIPFALRRTPFEENNWGEAGEAPREGVRVVTQAGLSGDRLGFLSAFLLFFPRLPLASLLRLCRYQNMHNSN